jgi:hypothetical protein
MSRGVGFHSWAGAVGGALFDGAWMSTEAGARDDLWLMRTRPQK